MILSIEEDLLRRAQSRKSPILNRFCTALNMAVQDFFENHPVTLPFDPLSAEQKAFMHALQLYDVQAALRLIANYDPSKGGKTVLSGIQKSCQSLSVIRRLEQFAGKADETRELASYRQRLENSLTRVLECERDLLNHQRRLVERLKLIPELPKQRREWFFVERMRALFSTDYRTYLILKNRYFQFRLENAERDETVGRWLRMRLEKILSGKELGITLNAQMDQLNFREMEQLVRDLMTQFGETPPLVANEVESVNEHTGTVLHDQGVDVLSSTPKPDSSLEAVESGVNFENPDRLTAYKKLCIKYRKPLEELAESIVPVDECSSPYFRAKSEDYTSEYTDFFQAFFNHQKETAASFRGFIMQLLQQRGEEFHAVERWGQLNESHYEGAHSRETPGFHDGMERQSEWSVLFAGRLPFMVRFPLEPGRIINLQKNRGFVLHVGTAFFDEDHPEERDEHPVGFVKLLFDGHILTRRTAVVYIGKTPYFTSTLKQLHQCRGLVLLLLMGLSLRFAIDFSPPMQDFLVSAVPRGINVQGRMHFQPYETPA